jgi:glycosyltransferase involved in cell wall biosynthesis
MHDLAGGGAERTILNIINNINKDLFDISLCINDAKSSDYINLLKDVKCYFLDEKKLSKRIFKLIILLRKLRPKYIFTTIYYNNHELIIAKLLSFIRTKIVIRESTNRSESDKGFLIRTILSYLLYKFSYKVIALSEGVKYDLIKYLKVNEKKIKVIYNPVNVSFIDSLANEKVNDFTFKKPTIISVGRLISAKNYPMLLNAMKLLLNKIDVDLIILGKGYLHQNLIDYALNLGIENNVHFLGFKENPYKYIKSSDVFVLTSNYEGFAHVITEALALKIPVVSTDCNYGPKEILLDGKYGSIVKKNDHILLAEIIYEILIKSEKFFTMVSSGRIRVRDFDVSVIIKEYEEIFGGKL